MPSKNGVMVYLSPEDKPLFDIAVKLWKSDDSKLAKEIIHSWIFNNKLVLSKEERK